MINNIIVFLIRTFFVFGIVKLFSYADDTFSFILTLAFSIVVLGYIFSDLEEAKNS